MNFTWWFPFLESATFLLCHTHSLFPFEILCRVLPPAIRKCHGTKMKLYVLLSFFSFQMLSPHLHTCWQCSFSASIIQINAPCCTPFLPLSYTRKHTGLLCSVLKHLNIVRHCFQPLVFSAAGAMQLEKDGWTHSAHIYYYYLLSFSFTMSPHNHFPDSLSYFSRQE